MVPEHNAPPMPSLGMGPDSRIELGSILPLQGGVTPDQIAFPLTDADTAIDPGEAATFDPPRFGAVETAAALQADEGAGPAVHQAAALPTLSPGARPGSGGNTGIDDEYTGQ